MHLKVVVDTAGWQAIPTEAGPPRWQSVTSDELTIQIQEYQAACPPMSDLGGVRDYFGGIVAWRKGALISCDPIPGPSAVVRVVSKYHSHSPPAMTYVASLAVPF